MLISALTWDKKFHDPGRVGDDAKFESEINRLGTRHKTSVLKSIFEMDEAQYFIQMADSNLLKDKDSKLLKAADLLASVMRGLRRRHDQFYTFSLANAEYLQGLLNQRQGHH